MLNTVFVWILNRGVELGEIVLLVLLFRVVLRRVTPRIFSYALWSVVPVSVVYYLLTSFLRRDSYWVTPLVEEMPSVGISEMGLRIGRWILMIGVFCRMLYLAYSYINLKRCLVGSIRLYENVYIAERITAPFSMGIVHPRIYLPGSLEKEYYAPVILHEKVHIARKDIWMKHVGMLLLTVFWFQPLLWFAYYLFVKDMEDACDEAVLQKSEEEFRVQYAKALVEVSYGANKVGSVVTGYGTGEIKGRIKHVIEYKKSNDFVRIVATVACLAFSILVISGLRLIPQLFRMHEETGIVVENQGNGLTIKETNIIEEILPIDE